MRAKRYFSMANLIMADPPIEMGIALFCVEAGDIKVHFEVKKAYGAPGIGDCRVLGECDGSCAQAGMQWEIDNFPEPWAEVVREQVANRN